MKQLMTGLLVSALLLVGGVPWAMADGKVQLLQSDKTVTPLEGVDGAAKVYEDSLGAGERNPSSALMSYIVVRQEANASIISKTTAVTIGGGVAGDTHLMGLLIHTALTGTCVITGFADSDGAAQSYTLPAGSVGYKDFLGAINSAGALTITCSNASDDNLVMVLWRPR